MQPILDTSNKRHSHVDRDWFFNQCVPIPFCGCWIWGRYTYDNGYGAVSENYRTVLAHRKSWILWHGAIPPGMRVLHRCDIPSCVNPLHLFLGTQRDNIQDCMAKGRYPWSNIQNRTAAMRAKTHCKNGHPFDSENTYMVGTERKCRTCRSTWWRKWKEKKDSVNADS